MAISILRKLLMPKTRVPRRSAGRTLEVERLEARWLPSTLTVGSGKQFATINAALMAASPGATIKVYPGTYSEQLTIATSGINLVAKPTTPTSNDVILTDPGVSDVTVGGTDIGGALIDITATNVKVTGFQIDGTSNDTNLFDDVRIRNGGSATISNNIILGPSNPGDASFGIGILVGTNRLAGTAGAGSAWIEKNTVSNYLSVGVLVDGSGAAGTVLNNVITGRGAANNGLAQYGVQISRGASARVSSNIITANTAGGNSGGIYFFQEGGKGNFAVTNTIDSNAFGILVEQSSGTGAAHTRVVGNTVTNSTGFAGIDVKQSDATEVEVNSVSHSANNGIALGFSSNVEVEGNSSFSNSSDGIYVFQGSGNRILANDSFGNTGGANGIFLEQSTGNLLLSNTTWGNDLNGIKVLGGSGNFIWLGDSHGNAQDGILLQNTTATSIFGNDIRSNGSNGVELQSSGNTLIIFNVILHNGGKSISVDTLSTNVMIFGNLTDG
jgi:parallel beta-helix repeat protein